MERRRRSHPRVARAATVVAGISLGLLALSWAAPALWIGLANPVFLVVLGGYAVALAVVAYKLLGGVPRPMIWSLLGVLLPLVPLGLWLLLRLVTAPQPTDPGEPDGSALFVIPSAVAAVAAVAFWLNRQVERT